MRAVLKKPQCECEIVEVENSREAFAKLIKCVTNISLHRQGDIVMVIDDCGKLIGLPFNFPLENGDCIVGSCLFVSYDGMDDDVKGLTDEQIEKVKNITNCNNLFV